MKNLSELGSLLTKEEAKKVKGGGGCPVCGGDPCTCGFLGDGAGRRCCQTSEQILATWSCTKNSDCESVGGAYCKEDPRCL